MNGTDVSEETRNRVRQAARDRCGYCLSPRRLVMSKLELEHIIPRAHGGSNDESNLWLSCSLCNRHKAAQVSGVDPRDNATVELFNPRNQAWGEHFKWSVHGTYSRHRSGIG
jgi:5-methylcytosine-specific restriction endonuclease McrA